MKRFSIETISGNKVGSGCLIEDGTGSIEIRGEQFRLRALVESDIHQFLPHVSPEDFVEVRKSGEKPVCRGSDIRRCDIGEWISEPPQIIGLGEK